MYKICEFSTSLIDVEVARMLGAKTVWINRKLEGNVDGVDFKGITFESFSDLFAYGLPNAKCFSGVEFDLADIKKQQVERYGGFGVGSNGGGARTTNNGVFQIKGSGRNCLAGEGNVGHHGYGGLDAHNAISEVIFSNLLNKILPIGAAQPYGLVFVAADAGRYGMDDANMQLCWGLMLVREATVRPAHFLPSPFFKPSESFRNKYVSDKVRVKAINRELKKILGGKGSTNFIQVLGKFLYNCANQFAFARVFRVCHTAITPSNISLDGRWLDVPTAAMVSSGVNFCRARDSFFSEAMSPISIVEELSYTYSKYNSTSLNLQPLANYYLEQFESFFCYHVGALVGLPEAVIENLLGNVEWKFLCQCVSSVLNPPKPIESSLPEVVEEDSIAFFLEGAFLALVDCESANKRFALIQMPNRPGAELIKAFPAILRNAYGLYLKGGPLVDFKYFSIACALKSLKKARMSAAFYSVSVDLEINKVCDSDDVSGVGPLIDDYVTLSDWVFEADSARGVTLFKSAKVLIEYLLPMGQYSVKLKGEKVCLAASFFELVSYLGSMDEGLFNLGSFQLVHYLSSLEKVIPALESRDDWHTL